MDSITGVQNMCFAMWIYNYKELTRKCQIMMWCQDVTFPCTHMLVNHIFSTQYTPPQQLGLFDLGEKKLAHRWFTDY